MNVREKLKDLKIERRAFINGKFVETKSTIKKKSSIDGSDLPEIFACDESEIDLAVQRAKKSQKSWAQKSPVERKNILLRLADLMEANRDELAILDTFETGRAFQNYFYDSIPKSQFIMDMERLTYIEAIRYFAEAIDKIYDVAIPARGSESGLIIRVPLGVVGAIVPWNDPLVVAAWKFAPALLMGNSIVLKPAEQSSLSSLNYQSAQEFQMEFSMSRRDLEKSPVEL